jgi:cytochrome c
MTILKTVAAGMAAAMVVCGPAQGAGDPVRGEAVYQGCMDCHSIDANDVGPKHKGIVGRKAGSVPDYKYSAALKNSNVIWTEENLDKWLTDPQKFIPGTKMFYSVNNPTDRADVIAFLKERAR